MFSSLTTYQDNATVITKQVVRLLRIRVTVTTLRHSLKEHPDYPSLLSIMDSFSSWKIRSIGIQAGMDQLRHFPTPFIAPIKGNAGDEFTVVKDIDEKTITGLLLCTRLIGKPQYCIKFAQPGKTPIVPIIGHVQMAVIQNLRIVKQPLKTVLRKVLQGLDVINNS